MDRAAALLTTRARLHGEINGLRAELAETRAQLAAAERKLATVPAAPASAPVTTDPLEDPVAELRAELASTTDPAETVKISRLLRALR